MGRVVVNKTAKKVIKKYPPPGFSRNLRVKLRDAEEHLPLLQVLSELKNDQRQIIIDKLDAPAIKALTKCVKLILGTRQLKMMLPFNEYLSSIVDSNKSQISSILQKKAKKLKTCLK